MWENYYDCVYKLEFVSFYAWRVVDVLVRFF